MRGRKLRSGGRYGWRGLPREVEVRRRGAAIRLAGAWGYGQGEGAKNFTNKQHITLDNSYTLLYTVYTQRRTVSGYCSTTMGTVSGYCSLTMGTVSGYCSPTRGMVMQIMLVHKEKSYADIVNK